LHSQKEKGMGLQDSVGSQCQCGSWKRSQNNVLQLEPNHMKSSTKANIHQFDAPCQEGKSSGLVHQGEKHHVGMQDGG